MKLPKRILSAFLAVTLIFQCGVTAFAEEPSERTEYSEDGVVYTYNADGTITATIHASPVVEQPEVEPEEDRLEDHGAFYANTADNVDVTLEKTYTDGETLVSVECDGAGVVFYPETVADQAVTIDTETVSEPAEAAETVTEVDAGSVEDAVSDTVEESDKPIPEAEPQEPIAVEPSEEETPEQAETPVSSEISAPTPASTEIIDQPDIIEYTKESESEDVVTPAEAPEVTEEPATVEEPETEEIPELTESSEEENTPAEAELSEEEIPVPTEAPEATEESAPTEAPETAAEAAPAATVEPTETTEPEETPAPAETPSEAVEKAYEPIAIYDSVDGVGTGYANGTYAAVLYSGAINEFTDVELIPTGNGVKENIIMRQYTTSEISYVLNFSGLTPVLSGRTVLLYDAEGEKIGEISAPYLVDADGVYNDNIHVSLEKIGSNYRLIYTMDEEWLQRAAYPVVLDPTTYIGKDSNGKSASHMEDGYVTSSAPNQSYKGLTNKKMYCGNVYGESLCLFRPVLPNSINEIADYILVKEVKLYTYVESVSGGNTYSLYQLMGDWSSNTVTYNTCPAYIASNTQSKYISSTGWYTWDLTPAASTWFNTFAQMQEYGVLIRGSKTGGSLVFASSDASSNNAYYSITYYPVSQSNPKDPNLKVTAKGNGANSGTGYLELNWDKVEGAQNYYVGIHNGKEYEYFYVTGTTSWTTKGKGIWPTETEINNGRYSLHHDGKGAELPMIPAFTYNNSGGTLAGSLNYSVCVIPANEYGQAPNPKYFGAKTAKLPDTLPPSQASTVSVSPTDYTNANTITVSWSGIKDYNNQDTSAVSSLGTGHVQYSINSTADWKNTSSSNGTGSAKIDVSNVQDGKNVIYLRATDSAGNTGTSQPLYFYIDRTPPTVPVVSVAPDNWSDADSVSLTWSGISDLNDLLRVEYAVDGGSYQSTEKTDPAYSGYAIDTSALTDGEHTIHVRAVDILGNTGEAATVAIYKDTTAPSVTETAVEPDSWTNANEITFGWTGLSDAHSGMALVWYSVDGGEQITLESEEESVTDLDVSGLSDGEHMILLHFEDQVGNSHEESLTLYRDATEPEIAILSPTDGSAVNGTVEVLGSVQDLSLESWTLTAVGEDGSERILASGDDARDAERLGVLNCALYEDGEKVELKLYAVDEAGNESEVTGTAIVVDKSATPISGTVTIAEPYRNEQITAPSTDGSYTVDYAQPEIEGLLYIDGVYQGSTNDGDFAFDAITYEENSVHSISVLSRSVDGTVQFSEGMSSYVLHADAFEDDSLLTSHSDATVDHGVSLNGGSSGTVISQTIKPALPILALRLDVTEDKPAGTDIRYYYSINNESTWAAITPDTDVPLLVRPDAIRLKAELIGDGTASPVLYGWTLQGAIETNPTRVSVKLTRPVETLDVSTTTVSSALTELTAQPKDAGLLRQYRDGDHVSGSFTYDARDVKDNEAHQVVLVAETADGVFYGTGAEVEILLRENVAASDTVISDALTADGVLYALRLEALYTGDTSFSYSTDGSTWNAITPGEYTYFDQASKQVYVRAQGGSLSAWHVEGIVCTETNVTARIMKAPTNVVAADWGADYYANEKLRYYVLSWTDPMAKDSTASYTTAYEIYRNGKLIATTADTRYTDHDYIAGARYEVQTVRTYKGFSGRNSAKTAAVRTNMKAPERVIGVNYTAEEQRQSEYLNKLYGGNYTFSSSAKAPVDDRALDMSLLGRNKICAYGWEPINFNTGNFLLETVDGAWADLGLAELTVDRTYNAQSDAADGPFGAHWSSTWTEHLRLYTEGDVVYVAADGAEIIFTMDANGVYSGGESRGLTLTTGDDGREYWITDLDGVTHAFTGMGLLSGIQWSDGNRITVRRDEDGLITGFALPSGETLNVESDKSGHITTIATLGGSTLKYEYQGNHLVAFTDADGSVTRYVYDSQSRMTEWYDAEDIRQVKNTYDSKSRVIAQIDANGGEYSLEYFDDHTVITDADAQVSEIWYDEQKRTTRTVDASGGEMGYEYDQFGNIVSMTDENGNTTHYEYDAAGNKIRETAPDGSSYSLAYDEHNNLTQLTDQLGNITRYEYDENNRLTRQTNPDGGETTYTYNAAGQVLSVTDALGNTTAYAYDGANLISSTDPNGNRTTYTYDGENRLVSTTDALGNTTAFAYDGADNLTSVTFADGTSFAYEYDRVGNLISQTDALGNVTAFEYDALRQLVKTTYPDGSEATGSYDASGNLISTTDADGNTATAAYDIVGNLVAVTDALGNTTAYEYDSAGNLTAETLANGGKTQYNYDNMGRVTSAVTATGETTQYTYDAADNILTVTAPDGGVTEYTYDSMGRLLTETAPDGAVTRYTYDLAGRLSTVTDANGNVTAYAFDANGNVLTVTDALGGVTRYEYDALNRVTSITDANGAVTGYTYDVVGNLASQTDALGNVTTYDYDSNGSITALTDALDGKTAMSYDELGNVISVLQKNSGTVNAEYDALGNLLKETDALGNTTSYEYNANGMVTKITDALGQGAEISYDEIGNVVAIGAPDGSRTSYTYDLSGRLTGEVSATGAKTAYTYDRGRLVKTAVNGNETTFTYDPAGNISSVTDAEGRKVELSYDALGNLTAVLYPDGTEDTYQYDALSRLVTYTPRDGDSTGYTYNAMGDVLTVTVGDQTTSYEYDLLGRTTAVVTADGARTEAEYDALGNQTRTVDALGNATAYHYTVDSLLEQVDYANGAKLTAAYDLTGNLISEVDPEGATTAYEYDPVGRMTAVTDALGNTNRYTYDAADNLTQVTDALGHVTEYTYDEAGNLLTETDALGNTVTYSYTTEGWLDTVTDAEGNITRYTYDRTGDILTVDYAGEQTEAHTYNEIGLLTTVTTAEGVTEYQYDDASRLISVTQPNGDTVSYTYDGHGNRLSMTYPDGKTVTYAYDEMDRLVSVTGVDDITTTYEYDALGRRTKTVGGKETTEYTYDEVGDLIAQTTAGSYNLDLSYTYDLSGRMTGESRTEKGKTVESAYTYDPLGQLTGFTRSDGITEGYTYDAAGNMLTKTQSGVKTEYTYNAANQLTQSVTSGNTTAYTYDANGNLTAKQSSAGTTRYTYNALNLLQSYTGEDGYTETYTYNTNRLLSSVTTPESTTNLTWDILYGDGVVISETSGKSTTDYTYGLDRISAITGSNRTEYIYDARGSVAAEVSYNNAWYTFGGTLGWKNVTSKSYTPFGEQIGEAVSGFGYNGEYYNAATGMVYLRARFYEPEMNRFSQKDILRGDIISGTSLNRYLYCQNDPVNYADCNGQQMVAVSLAEGGGKYYGGIVYQRRVSEAKRLVNEAKQYVREAEAAYQKAQAAAPGSQLAKNAMTQWKKAKAAASRASSNLMALKKATTAAAGNQYLKNVRSAHDSAYQAMKSAQAFAVRAASRKIVSISKNHQTSNRSTDDTTRSPGQVSTPESEAAGCNSSTNNISEDQIREAINSNGMLRLLLNTNIGGNVGFALSGGVDAAFAVDKSGDIYLLLTAGAGGGLGLEGDTSPQYKPSLSGSLPLDLLGDINIVDSIDERDGWGVSIGGTALVFSAELRSNDPNVSISSFGITKKGLNFHAHIIYTWSIKIGNVFEEE